jgi:uncharacterized protein DUF6932
VLPCLDPITGMLPLGRHACSAAEVEIAFVKDIAFFGSRTRPGLWSDWNDALATLQSSVTVHAAWIAGSFTTAKPDPDDIDVTFIVNGEDYRQRGQQDQQIVSLFLGYGRVRATLGLRVDSYVIPWERYLGSPLQQVHADYFWARGHWDDWWQRARQAPKANPPEPPAPGDAVPRRGYLEVLLSDYPR